MTSDDRTERVHVRVSKAEAKMLRELAQLAGLSSADIVRTLIRDAYAEKLGDKRKR